MPPTTASESRTQVSTSSPISVRTSPIPPQRIWAGLPPTRYLRVVRRGLEGHDAIGDRRTLGHGTFTITDLAGVQGHRIALDGAALGNSATTCSDRLPSICEDTRATPVLDWQPVERRRLLHGLPVVRPVLHQPCVRKHRPMSRPCRGPRTPVGTRGGH